MKKKFIHTLSALLLYSVLIPLPVFSTTTVLNKLPSDSSQSARIMGMGSAFTAVADDAYALFSNPSGLAYLKNPDLVLGGSFSADVIFNTMQFDDYFMFQNGTAPNVSFWDAAWLDFDEQGFYVWDFQDYTNHHLLDNGTSYNDAIIAMGFTQIDGVDNANWQNFSLYNSVKTQVVNWYALNTAMYYLSDSNLMNSLSLLPNVLYADTGWAVGVIGDRTVTPAQDSGEYELAVDITINNGLAFGLGTALGPIAIGTTIKSYTSNKFTFGIPDSEDYQAFLTDIEANYQVANPSELGAQLFYGDVDHMQTTKETHMTAGFGAMYTSGNLTIGAYAEDLISWKAGCLDVNGITVNTDIWENTSIGIALEPGREKRRTHKSIINTLLSADIQFIGNDEKRVLALGGEFGIHLGDILTADFRTGYRQGLNGTHAEIMENGIIDFSKGEVTFGFGGRALLFYGDIAFALPAKFIRDSLFTSVSSDFLTDESYLQQFGQNGPRFMISGGIRL